MLSERQQNHLFKRLGSLKSNNTCADCYVKGATWTSVDFGVFVCINCSGSHRSLGMHITRVRSTKLDNWSREDAKIMELVGNEIANAYYLGSKNKKFMQGQSLSFGNSDNRRNHVKKKYVDRIYVKSNMVTPAEFVKQKGYNLKKEDLRNKYLGNTATPNNIVNPNKKKPISLKGLKKSQKKKESTMNNDLLNMDFDITPANKAPADLWDFPSKKTESTPSNTKPQASNDNLLDFDFGTNSKPVVKDTNDFLNFGANVTSNNFPKPPSKNPQMFHTNQNNTTGQNDKYNCLSFNPQPVNKHFFYSNQGNGTNNNWNGNANTIHNGNHSNNNTWGMMNKPKNTIPDKYDVFDMYMNNNRNGYFN